MTNLKNKVSAFTLVEVIMVMILSLLVLGIIMLGFRHFQQYRSIQEKESQRIEDVLLIQSALNSWFYKAHEIQFVDEVLVFKDSIVFGTCGFEEEMLIMKSNNSIDQFKITPRNLRVSKAGDLPFVTELYFEISSKGAQSPYLFRKEYGKSVLFNSKENDYEH